MGANGTEGVQSRDLCFYVKVKTGKNNKELLQMEFKPFYDDVNKFEDKNSYNNVRDRKARLFCIAHPADMVALQKLVGRGDTMKNQKYAYFCCNIHIDKVHVPNIFPCDFCTAHGKTHCYHHKVCTFKQNMKQCWNSILTC